MITLEALKADERKLVFQLGQTQGALDYNRIMQASLQDESAKQDSAPPAAQSAGVGNSAADVIN